MLYITFPGFNSPSTGLSCLLGVCSLFSSFHSSVDESQVRLVSSGGSLFESCRCTLQNSDVFWTLNGYQISSTLADISHYITSSHSQPTSNLALKNITKAIAGSLCCGQTLSTPDCVTIVVDEYPPPIVSIALAPATVPMTGSPDGQTATVVCSLVAYGDHYAKSGYMTLYVNSNMSKAYDLQPDIQDDIRSGESNWKMQFHILEHIHEGDRLQCVWWTYFGSTGTFVSKEITVEFESQLSTPDLPVDATNEAHSSSSHISTSHSPSASKVISLQGELEDNPTSSGMIKNSH